MECSASWNGTARRINKSKFEVPYKQLNQDGLFEVRGRKSEYKAVCWLRLRLRSDMRILETRSSRHI